MSDLTQINLNNNLRLNYIDTTKFKTNRISLYFKRKLSKNEATKNALLAMIMERSSTKYPKTEDISKFLQQNYGANFTAFIKKKGDYQLLVFSIDFISENFVKDKTPILENILDFFTDIIFNQQQFNQEYFEQEKNNLKLKILSQQNDKKSYAKMRCIEEMCKNEAYGINELGYLEELQQISSESLFDHYRNVILHVPFELFVVGQCNIQNITKKFECITEDYVIGAMENQEPDKYLSSGIKEVKNVVEEDKVVQAKLVIGCRINIEPNSEDYFKLVVYNTLFGGGPYSKLFNNVREKLSLAYYVFSMFDRFKNVMTINAGIESKKFKTAYEEILKQRDSIAKNQFSDTELSSAQMTAITSINTQADSPSLLEDFYYSALMANRNENIQQFINKLNQVSRENVVEVANKMQLDVVYLLKEKN